MTDWWTVAYPGGPMVRVKGFPRVLYPPDAAAHGYPPSKDGPDVEAYKRTVSRLGRWPWQQFNRKYSDDFAHGTSGNVGQTGMAGFQRQMHIDDTGYIGTSTFNALRSARIPASLPHAGEPGMDATAVTLINQAYDLFKGHEPPPPPAESIRHAALMRAVTQIGTVEHGDNMQPYGEWYGMNGVPWCAIFATWCYEHGAADLGKDSPSFKAGSYYSYVPYIVGDARNGRNGLKTTDSPIPGDLVCYDWNWDGTHDHVGIFEAWHGADFSTVEGNTSAADYSNGGMVLRCTRNKSQQGTVFVRVAE